MISDYSPFHTTDLMKPVLTNVVENFPPEGNQVLCRFILQNHNRNSLQILAAHSSKAILAPTWLPELTSSLALVYFC